ncbi:nuclear localized protein [Tasmannia lanceolata]|uniref:nuclear localized protein n=1 Tax=Tasmannia lanceolata TaxID=3420 RepID=UPI0040633DDA
MEVWEALDVDDSDLYSNVQLSTPSSHLSLSLQPCSKFPRPSQPQSTLNTTNPATLDSDISSIPPPRLIPGPAGAIQAAMHRQSLNPQSNSQHNLGRLELDAEDQDFKQNPWFCAMDFLAIEADFAMRSPLLCSIDTIRSTDRIPQVVGIVKSCTPNGLGDLIVTLKDPSGTIGASIHRKVLLESEFGRDISVGAVVILKQVVVFSPTRSARYLNVTLNNVVKIISKDSGPPPQQRFPASSVRCAASGADELITVGPARAEVSSLISKGAGVANETVRRDPIFDKEMVDKTRPEGTAGSKTTVSEGPNHESCGGSRVKQGCGVGSFQVFVPCP